VGRGAVLASDRATLCPRETLTLTWREGESRGTIRPVAGTEPGIQTLNLLVPKRAGPGQGGLVAGGLLGAGLGAFLGQEGENSTASLVMPDRMARTAAESCLFGASPAVRRRSGFFTCQVPTFTMGSER